MDASQLAMMNFADPSTMADLMAQQQQLQQKQALAQQLMSQQYVPNSGRGGVIGAILGNLAGGMLQSRNNEKMSDLLRQQLTAQSQAAQAARTQQIQDEYRKMQEDIFKQSSIDTNKSKAERDYQKRDVSGGMIVDPTNPGASTAIPGYMDQQLALKAAEAKIAAANRQGPADPFREIKMGLQMGIITPEQAQQAMQQKLLGGGNPETQIVGDYLVDKRTGGTKPLTDAQGNKIDITKNQPLTAEAKTKLSLIDNAIANAQKYQSRVSDGKGGFNDIISMTGDTPELMKSAVQDMLYAKSGASAPAAEVEKAMQMYSPSRTLFGLIPTEKDSTASAKVQNFITDMQRMRGEIGGTAPQAQAAQGATPAPTQTAVNPQTGQRIGLVNGQWVPI